MLFTLRFVAIKGKKIHKFTLIILWIRQRGLATYNLYAQFNEFALFFHCSASIIPKYKVTNTFPVPVQLSTNIYQRLDKYFVHYKVELHDKNISLLDTFRIKLWT